MAEVTLKVGGRPFTVSCADGEEEHVTRLAAIVDSKLARLGGALPPGDTKGLLFAALFLADELEDLKRRAAPPSPSPMRDELPTRLEAIADTMEKLADTLESGQAGA